MDALSLSSPSLGLESRSSVTSETLSSPESCGTVGSFIEMSELMLPASALESELFGVPQDSSATVVSTSSCDEIPPPDVITTTTSSKSKSKSSRKSKSSSAASERRHALPSTAMRSESPLGETVTQPVPEFLCHLSSMLRDPSYSDLISWVVPSHDESDLMGGGIRGIGKIVVHKPESLQDSVLGNYYRHSKYASFQRQLNYFGFKKRLHGGKKGKLSPCSYIHESLDGDVRSLLTLKRRPPAKKRMSVESAHVDFAVSVPSHEESSPLSPSRSKKRRVTVEMSPEKKLKKISKKRSKKDKKKQKLQGKQQIAVIATPHQVEAEECGPPSNQSSLAIESNQNHVLTNENSGVATTTSITTPVQPVSPSNTSNQSTTTSSSTSQPSLLELLSTSLPPSEILFNDVVDADSMDEEGIPAWMTDDGKYHYHNVDSSLVDLAMIY